jgi:hypothetical protein
MHPNALIFATQLQVEAIARGCRLAGLLLGLLTAVSASVTASVTIESACSEILAQWKTEAQAANWLTKAKHCAPTLEGQSRYGRKLGCYTLSEGEMDICSEHQAQYGTYAITYTSPVRATSELFRGVGQPDMTICHEFCASSKGMVLQALRRHALDMEDHS